MIPKWLGRSAWIAFAFFAIIDCSLAGSLAAGRVQLTRIMDDYGTGTDPAPTFVGYREDGKPVTYSGVEPGLAVWYASRACPYCERDLEWDRLSSKLQEQGVRIVILLPAAGLSFLPEKTRPRTTEQVAFVDGAWLRRYPLSVTPTLLLFDRHQRLVWHKWGSLTAEDTGAALNAIAGRAHR